MTEPPNQLAQRTVRGALWTGLSQYWLFALGVAKTVVLARLIEPQYFGILALSQAWMTYLTLLRFDFRTAVITWVEDPAMLAVQFWLEVLLAAAGVVLALLLYLLVPGILFVFGAAQADWLPAVWGVIFVLMALTIVEAVCSTGRYLAERRMLQAAIGKLTVVQSIVGLVVAVWLAWSGYPLAALLVDAALPVLVVGAGAAWVSGWRPQLIWDTAIARRLLALGFTMWTAGLLGKIVFQFDDWLVGTIQRPRLPVWRGSGVLPESFYSRAYTAGKMPMDIFASAISMLALPLYARSEAQGRDMLRRIYRRTTWLLAYLIFFSSAVALTATAEVVQILLGPAWLDTVPLFRLMSLFVLLRPMYQNACQMLLAVGREREMRATVAVQAAFLLLAGPPAVLWQGAAGAAVAVSVMSVIGLAAVEWHVQKELTEAVWPLYLLPAATLAALMLALQGLAPFLPASIWWSAGIKLALCSAAYALAIVTLQRKMLQVVRDTLMQSLWPAVRT